MKVDDCYLLGQIVKPHGLKGELQIYLDVDYPEEYDELESVFILQKNQLIPFFIEYLSLQPGSKAIVKFEEISSREAAQNLSKCQLYLPLDTLPDLESDQYYYHEVANYTMLENNLRIGNIKQVINTGPQHLFEVDIDGIEILVPIVDEIVLKVDTQQREVHVALPKGLIDIYKDQESNED